MAFRNPLILLRLVARHQHSTGCIPRLHDVAACGYDGHVNKRTTQACEDNIRYQSIKSMRETNYNKNDSTFENREGIFVLEMTRRSGCMKIPQIGFDAVGLPRRLGSFDLHINRSEKKEMMSGRSIQSLRLFVEKTTEFFNFVEILLSQCEDSVQH